MLYRQIFSDNANEFDAVWGVAECFHSLGEINLAIEWYKKYLEFEPNEPEAMHMLSALGENIPPRRASNAYLIAHFNRFAQDFDKHLTETLNYRVPDLIYTAFRLATSAFMFLFIWPPPRDPSIARLLFFKPSLWFKTR